MEAETVWFEATVIRHILVQTEIRKYQVLVWTLGLPRAVRWFSVICSLQEEHSLLSARGASPQKQASVSVSPIRHYPCVSPLGKSHYTTWWPPWKPWTLSSPLSPQFTLFLSITAENIDKFYWQGTTFFKLYLQGLETVAYKKKS